MDIELALIFHLGIMCLLDYKLRETKISEFGIFYLAIPQ